MDFSLITEKQIEIRYNELSAKLRDVIDSPTKLSQVQQICKRNNFDDERTLITQQLITLIFLGFIPIDHFRQELIDNLHIDYRHASDIGNEVGEKIFSGVREELEVAYNPLKFGENEILEDEAVENNIVDLRSSDQIIDLDSSLQTSPQPSPYKGEGEILESNLSSYKGEEDSLKSKASNPESNLEAPAIIHQELEVKPAAKIKNSLGGIFGMFKDATKYEQNTKLRNYENGGQPIIAQIVGGNGDASQKTDPDGSVEPEITKTEGPKFRVVHYSDYKTPLNPFGGEADQNPEKMFVPENKTVLDNLQLITDNQKQDANKNLDKGEAQNSTTPTFPLSMGGGDPLIVPPASIEIVAGKQSDSMTSPQPSPYKGEGEILESNLSSYKGEEASFEPKTFNLELSSKDEKPMEINLGDIDQSENPPNPLLERGQEEAPAIIHEELKDNKSALKEKSFFGGFFGMFKSQKPEARNRELGKGIITDPAGRQASNGAGNQQSQEILNSQFSILNEIKEPEIEGGDVNASNGLKMVVKQVDYLSTPSPVLDSKPRIDTELTSRILQQNADRKIAIDEKVNDDSWTSVKESALNNKPEIPKEAIASNFEPNLVNLGEKKLEVDENVIDLKDIPVKEDVIDLRDLNQ